jgi:predicted transcriptional regulator of viral defense system
MKWTIIKEFSVKNRNCFSYQDVITEYPDKDRSYLSKVLASMVKDGMLMKLYRDVYHIIPLSDDPQTYSPDSRLIARCLMKRKEYYIAFASAM